MWQVRLALQSRTFEENSVQGNCIGEIRYFLMWRRLCLPSTLHIEEHCEHGETLQRAKLSVESPAVFLSPCRCSGRRSAWTNYWRGLLDIQSSQGPSGQGALRWQLTFLTGKSRIVEWCKMRHKKTKMRKTKERKKETRKTGNGRADRK